MKIRRHWCKSNMLINFTLFGPRIKFPLIFESDIRSFHTVRRQVKWFLFIVCWLILHFSTISWLLHLFLKLRAGSNRRISKLIIKLLDIYSWARCLNLLEITMIQKILELFDRLLEMGSFGLRRCDMPYLSWRSENLWGRVIKFTSIGMARWVHLSTYTMTYLSFWPIDIKNLILFGVFICSA